MIACSSCKRGKEGKREGGVDIEEKTGQGFNKNGSFFPCWTLITSKKKWLKKKTKGPESRTRGRGRAKKEEAKEKSWE